MYLGSPHPIHPSIISFFGFFLGFERCTVIKGSPFFFQPACRVHALFFSMHLLPLSVRALLACVYGPVWDGG